MNTSTGKTPTGKESESDIRQQKYPRVRIGIGHQTAATDRKNSRNPRRSMQKLTQYQLTAAQLPGAAVIRNSYFLLLTGFAKRFL